MTTTVTESHDSANRGSAKSAGSSRLMRQISLLSTVVLASVLSIVGTSAVLNTQSTASNATSTQAHSKGNPTSGPITLTSSELAQWQAMTATPFERAKVVADLQQSFAGVANVGAGNEPTMASASSATGTTDARLVMAYGITSDHFWITASYSDMARGAIWGAVAACSTRLPGWLCSAAGSLLSSWASGWGSASNHGVWAAIYWNPAHVSGGRW